MPQNSRISFFVCNMETKRQICFGFFSYKFVKNDNLILWRHVSLSFYIWSIQLLYPRIRTTENFHYYHDIKRIAKENIFLLVNWENRLPEGNSLFQIMETILNFRKRTKFFRKYHWVRWNNDIVMWTLLTSRRRWWWKLQQNTLDTWTLLRCYVIVKCYKCFVRDVIAWMKKSTEKEKRREKKRNRQKIAHLQRVELMHVIVISRYFQFFNDQMNDRYSPLSQRVSYCSHYLVAPIVRCICSRSTCVLQHKQFLHFDLSIRWGKKQNKMKNKT